MPIVMTDDTNYTAIANAIRAKKGSSDTYTPGQMADAITAIESGSYGNVIDALITADTTEDIAINSSVTALRKYACAYNKNVISVICNSALSAGISTFYYCSRITTATLNQLDTIINSMFGNCPLLEYAEFASATKMYAGAFLSCASLTAVVLRSNTLCTLYSTSSFENTPIESGTGYIYVPLALVNDYKAATNWTVYADQIRAIEDYPEITGG